MKGTGYLLQATLITLWWLGLSVDDYFFQAFQFPGINKEAFNAFFIPDIVIIALLSVIRAYRANRTIELVILGGFAYGTLYCINATILTGGGYLATLVMTLGLCFNLFLVFQDVVFRESKSQGVFINGLKTFIQIICVWTITLVLFPWLIMESFHQPIEPRTGGWLIVGITLLILSSTLGLASAITMVRVGSGTPLPIDQTKKLVTAGPYQFVRNPMAIAGLGQGIAVSIIFGSLLILLYTFLGAILWQLVVRPIEENNMRKRFGRQYEAYCNSVSCWIPHFKRHAN